MAGTAAPDVLEDRDAVDEPDTGAPPEPFEAPDPEDGERPCPPSPNAPVTRMATSAIATTTSSTASIRRRA